MGLFDYFFFFGVFVAILALKEQLMRFRASNVQPDLEEFIPMKKD